MGIWLKVDSGSLLGLLEGIENGDGLDQLVHVAYVLIGVGAALVIIGFLGCCGAVKESRCMLLTVSFLGLDQRTDSGSVVIQSLLCQELL